jgi:hypothetical protein
VGFNDKNVSDVSVGCAIGNDAGEPDLRVSVKNVEAKRIFNGTLDDIARDSLGPIAAGEKSVDHFHVEARLIG